MADYTPPPGSERFAERVHRHDLESEVLRGRLNEAPTEEVKRVLLDVGESQTARIHALFVFRERRDPALPEILLHLFDDPDSDLWHAAIHSYFPPDPRILERLRGTHVDELLERRAHGFEPGDDARATVLEVDEQREVVCMQHLGDSGHRHERLATLGLALEPVATTAVEQVLVAGPGHKGRGLIFPLGEVRPP